MLPKGTVILTGVARSGTSWLGQLIDSSPDVCFRFQPFFSYAFKNYVDYDSDKKRYETFFESLVESNDIFLTQADKREQGIYPKFNKNTPSQILVLKENRYQYLFPKILSYFRDFKLLCIVRNPSAVINSWVKSPKEFPATADINKEWRFGACKNEGKEENFFGFYKWRETANLYLDLKDKFPKNVFIVKYEELVDNTYNETEKIFNFLNLELMEQTQTFIKESHLKHIDGQYSVYKDVKVKNDWKHELGQHIIDEINFELSDTRLAQFLL